MLVRKFSVYVSILLLCIVIPPVALSQSGQPDMAPPSAQPAIQERLPAAQLAYDRAQTLYKNGEFFASITAFAECLKTSPKDTECLYYRGLSYHREERFEEAVNDLTSAIKINPNAPTQFYMSRALSYMAMEKFTEAITDLDTAIGMNAPAEAYLSRARAQYERGAVMIQETIESGKENLKPAALALLEKSLADTEKFISLKPEDYRGYFYRGEFYFGKWNRFGFSKDYSYVNRAIEDVTKAISFSPLDAEPYNLRAAAYELLGKDDLAAADRRMSDEVKKKK